MSEMLMGEDIAVQLHVQLEYACDWGAAASCPMGMHVVQQARAVENACQHSQQ